MSTAKRIARNTVANWLGIAVGSIVILVLTPFLVAMLGDERFGVYAIASQTLLYVSLMALGMRGSVTRFAAREIAAEAPDKLNTILSTTSLFALCIGVVGMAACALVGALAPSFFGLTPALATETLVLFVGIGLTFVISLQAHLFAGVLIGHQRYDLVNAGHILREVTRGVLIVSIVWLGWRSLSAVIIGVLIAHVLELVYARYVARRVQPTLRIAPHRAHGETAREILGFSLWNGLVQIGNVATFSTPIFVVGRILGPDQVVYYAVPFMIANRLRILVAGLAQTLAPIAASTLVSGDRKLFRELLVGGTRAAATLCFPIGAIALVLCHPFLNIWLGPEYASAWPVFGVLMISMFGRISQEPTLHILTGGGSIRGLAWIQLCSAAVTITITVLAASRTNWGVVGVAAGVTVPLFITHTLLLPWYAVRQTDMSVWRYLVRAYSGPMVSTAPGLAVALLFRQFWPIDGWMPLIVAFTVSLGVSAIPAWYTCLDPQVRRRVSSSLGLIRT